METVKGNLPLAVTVHSSAPRCRARIARQVMIYKHARTLTELQEETKDYTELYNSRPYLLIDEWVPWKSKLKRIK